MKAYQTGVITKQELIKELEWHKQQDNFRQGDWFSDGKGCAVGCSLESVTRKKGLSCDFSDFSKYEDYLGIPKWLAEVEEKIFEGMALDDSKEWVLDFSNAISEGQDLEKVRVPFIVSILKRNIKTLKSLKNIEECIRKECINANELMIEAQSSGDEERIDSAAYSAHSAVVSAESAVYSEHSAAELARSAAVAAELARSAARSARSAAVAAELARSVAAESAYKEISEDLIRIIKENA